MKCMTKYLSVGNSVAVSDMDPVKWSWDRIFFAHWPQFSCLSLPPAAQNGSQVFFCKSPVPHGQYFWGAGAFWAAAGEGRWDSHIANWSVCRSSQDHPASIHGKVEFKLKSHRSESDSPTSMPHCFSGSVLCCHVIKIIHERCTLHK